MKVSGDYDRDGYARVERLVAPEIARAFLHRLLQDLQQSRISLQTYAMQTPLLRQPSIEIYGQNYKPMITFLWGLTPIMAQLTGRDLLPTYNYFRIYGQGNVCRVHSDRAACEHSLSLTLAYSDGKSWDLELGTDHLAKPKAVSDGWDGDPHSAIQMEPGDAVLYQGVTRRHGRTTANPNAWSAHMFLHWVDREGPFRDAAFEGTGMPPERIELGVR